MENQPANTFKNLLLELLFFSVLLIAATLESYKILKAYVFSSKHPKSSQLSNKTRIFITGSSGNMGFETFKILYKNGYRLVLLNLDTPQTRKMFSQYKSDPNVKLYWGNLMNYTDVLNCVSQSDFVLHVGGMVSPYADYYPTKTLKTNIFAAENIVKAVKNISSEIKVVYIGSVSQTGDRNPPIHWGRTGDPIKISVYDHYAISKTIAERIFAESGLPFWISLRQSAMIYPKLVKNLDPIIYHIPIKGVLEWSTIEDSANLMLKIVSTELPYKFWRSFYNIESGDEYRLINYEITEIMLNIMGFPARKVFDSN
jgi:nucleoside-diphosphate-sugar epimerase